MDDIKEERATRPYIRHLWALHEKRTEMKTYLHEIRMFKLNDKNINDNTDAAWEIMKGLYYNVLFKDPRWHFFFEGCYNIVRFSERLLDEVRDYLDDAGVEYKYLGEYHDEQEITFRYQKIFEKMFHSFSMMAIEEFDSKHIHRVFDRVAHCFLNHQYMHLKPKLDKMFLTPAVWEADIMCRAGFGRAHYVGWIQGIEQGREDSKKRLNKDIVGLIEEHWDEISEIIEEKNETTKNGSIKDVFSGFIRKISKKLRRSKRNMDSN